jgi:flagellar basal body-associated protein FliL
MSDAKDPKKGADGKGGDAVAAPAKAGGSKLIPIVMGVNSLLLVGVMAFLVLQMKQQQQMFASILDDTSKTKRADPGDKAEKGEKAEASGKGEEKAEKKGEEKEEKSEGGGEKGEGKGEGGPAKGATMVRLADFVIHLRNPDADRYARMSFDVEVFGDSDKERLNASSPRVRDAFIGYLSDRTMEDLRGSEGLSRTKEALQTMLRQVAPDVRVRALYISDFVVQ